MTHSLAATEATTSATVAETADSTKALRTLYYVRFGFAVVWAVLMMIVATTISTATIALLVIYPLFDVAAAVIDFRSSGASHPKALQNPNRGRNLNLGLFINMALSLLTAIALPLVVSSGPTGVLRVWGAWAITAGIVQLIVAIVRYRLGGQWAMILSGGISVLAGGSFIAMSGGPDASLAPVAGYAILGGIFFLISAIRLHRLAARGK